MQTVWPFENRAVKASFATLAERWVDEVAFP